MPAVVSKKDTWRHKRGIFGAHNGHIPGASDTLKPMTIQSNSGAGKLAENSEVILRMYANGDSVADIQRALAATGTVVGHPALSRWIKRRLAVKSERALALNPVLLEATKLLASATNLVHAGQATPSRTPPSSKSTHALAPATSHQPEGPASETITPSKPKYEVGDLSRGRKSSLADDAISSLKADDSASSYRRKTDPS